VGILQAFEVRGVPVGGRDEGRRSTRTNTKRTTQKKITRKEPTTLIKEQERGPRYSTTHYKKKRRE